MSSYGVTDVQPNLQRLLQHQGEDRLQYFVGTGDQLDTLRRRFREYERNYRTYIRAYERATPSGGD
jgi:hypothetical protein